MTETKIVQELGRTNLIFSLVDSTIYSDEYYCDPQHSPGTQQQSEELTVNDIFRCQTRLML
jgi:hypothetical protein